MKPASAGFHDFSMAGHPLGARLFCIIVRLASLVIVRL